MFCFEYRAFNAYKILITPEWHLLKGSCLSLCDCGSSVLSSLVNLTGSGMLVYVSYLSKDREIVDSAKKNRTLSYYLQPYGFSILLYTSVFAYSAMDTNRWTWLLYCTLPKYFRYVLGSILCIIILFTASPLILEVSQSLPTICFELLQESFMPAFS